MFEMHAPDTGSTHGEPRRPAPANRATYECSGYRAALVGEGKVIGCGQSPVFDRTYLRPAGVSANSLNAKLDTAVNREQRLAPQR
jgi:hypothetical protein